MSGRIQTLDGLRGVAILLVLAGHAAANLQPLDPTWREWLVAFANPGAGVRLFFVLSGYLITHLLLNEHDRTGRISIPQFYLRRAWRILPAFYAYLLAITLISQVKPLGINADTFVAAATFTWNYQAFWAAAPADTWALGHLWTLAMEQQFYLLWPIVLVVLGRRRALWFAITLMLWCPLARVGTYYIFPGQRGLIGMMLHTGVDSLMCGCATALLMRSAGSLDWLKQRTRSIMLAAALWLLVLSPVLGHLLRGFGVSAGFTLDALAAGALVACVHLAPMPRVDVWLGRGLLPLFGLVSYSLYLWQQVFLSPTGWLAEGRLALPLLAACVAAAASYFFIEKPALRLKNRTDARAPRLVFP